MRPPFLYRHPFQYLLGYSMQRRTGRGRLDPRAGCVHRACPSYGCSSRGRLLAAQLWMHQTSAGLTTHASPTCMPCSDSTCISHVCPISPARRSVRAAYPFLSGETVFSYDPPASAGPVDVAARAADFARQYIEEDVRGEQRQAAVAWEKAAWVEEALAWLRDEGVQLPDDMEEKVAAAAAAAATEAAAEDGQGAAGGGTGKEVSEAERRRHLPELKRVAQKAAEGGPDAQRSWRELAVRLAALARVSRRRLLRQQADAAAAQGPLLRRDDLDAAAASQADDLLQETEQGRYSSQGSEAAAAELQRQVTEALAAGASLPEGDDEEEEAAAAVPRAAAVPQAEPEAAPEGSLVAALLRLFEPGAAEKAHAAARKLKSEVMKHNSEVAAEFLAGTARLRTQVEAEAAAAREASQQQQQREEAGKEAAHKGSGINPVQLERELYRIAAAERANPTGYI